MRGHRGDGCNAVRIQRGSDFRIRSDLSCTIFLSDPDSYDGGELTVLMNGISSQFKLAAGAAIPAPISPHASPELIANIRNFIHAARKP